MPFLSNYQETVENSFKCQISLKGGKWTFKTGENIEGSLLVTNDKEIYCYGISVNLEGKAMVKFEDNNNHVHWDEEELITASCYVFGKRSNVKRMLLKASHHEFPFSFQVLPTCHYPSSFKSPHGAVVYQLVAYMQTYSGSCKKEEQIIILHGNYMLDPSSDEPVRFTRSPPIFPRLVQSPNDHKLKVIIQLEKNGYLPGESVNFVLRLDNPHRQNVYTMTIKLVLRVNFYSGNTHKSISRIIMTKENHSRITSDNKLTWKDSINIPRGFIAPSCTNIIENQYFLQVEIFTNGSNNESPTVEKVPIFIGTGRKLKDTDDCHTTDLQLFYRPLT